MYGMAKGWPEKGEVDRSSRLWATVTESMVGWQKDGVKGTSGETQLTCVGNDYRE